VGAQGGDAGIAAKMGANSERRGMVISSSRGIIYASDDPARFAAQARRACLALRDEINEALQGPALTESLRA
jgi:orotidine-5'-phosphate decarboxylase